MDKSIFSIEAIILSRRINGLAGDIFETLLFLKLNHELW